MRVNSFSLPTRVQCWILVSLAVVLGLAVPATHASEVRVINLDGIISVANADFFIRSLEEAQAEGAHLVVLRIDTPGGLDQAMRDMIKAILASRIPVATYVSPRGARAASAGTYLMYASHVAAMSPATNIGSSTPVSLGGNSGPSKPSWNPFGNAPDEQDDGAAPTERDGADNSAETADSKPEKPGPEGSSMERKIVNDAVAYIKSLAELRGRNSDWAERTVREAANLTASEALEMNVIDYLAQDITDLLNQIDGLTLTVQSKEVTLDTKGAVVTTIEPDWRSEFLAILTNPTVALGLITLGVWGLIYEFSNPGSWVGGVAGVIFILLGAYGLNMLPINYAGGFLILLGLALMVMEALTPAFGVLLVGGCAAFIIGAIILFGTDVPGMGIHIGAIVGLGAATGILVVWVVGSAIRARRSPVVSGSEAMVGSDGVVIGDFDVDGTGRVRAAGEIWQACSKEPLNDGQVVTVTRLDKLKVTVASKEREHS